MMEVLQMGDPVLLFQTEGQVGTSDVWSWSSRFLFGLFRRKRLSVFGLGFLPLSIHFVLNIALWFRLEVSCPNGDRGSPHLKSGLKLGRIGYQRPRIPGLVHSVIYGDNSQRLNC